MFFFGLDFILQSIPCEYSVDFNSTHLTDSFSMIGFYFTVAYISNLKSLLFFLIFVEICMLLFGLKWLCFMLQVEINSSSYLSFISKHVSTNSCWFIIFLNNGVFPSVYKVPNNFILLIYIQTVNQQPSMNVMYSCWFYWITILFVY